MGIRKIVSLTAAVTVVAAAAFSNSAPARISGDVNGDRRVDVLDIQAVIGGALTGQASGDLTDVNGDGQTDVLDFQLTQARAVESAEEPTLPSEKPPLEACYLAGPALPPLWVDRAIAGVVTLASPPVARPSAPTTCGRAKDAKTERYLYRLTPNAPPVCA